MVNQLLGVVCPKLVANIKNHYQSLTCCLGNFSRIVVKNYIAAALITILTLVWINPLAGAVHSQQTAQQRRGVPKQDPVTTQCSTSESRSSSVLTDPEKDYRIAAGDVIQILIQDAPELSHFYRVNTAGLIEMPEPIGL